jgi:dihydroorotate dehydrogenase electron transfer subunit
MKKVNYRLHVIENRPLSPEVFVLTLGLGADEIDNDIVGARHASPLQDIKPGQFASILVEPANDTFLRRPFSIHNVDVAHRTIKFYVQKKGKGTEQLSKLTTNDSVDVIFPLGNGFSIKNGESRMENDGQKPNSQFSSQLLIGGGCGIAPLLYLAKTLNQKNIRPTILIGGRSKKNILCIEEFVKYGKVLVTTEDGSLGDKGFVTEHSIFHQQKFDQIYCCGPEPMMKAVAKIAIEQNIPCQISLENMMACGIGACLCCVTQTKNGHQCVCTEGPVFDVSELKIEN